MTYTIRYGTGAGDETGIESLDEAKQIADNNATHTQCSITIEDEDGNDICMRKWWGVEFDDNVDPSENPIQFGNFGYYADWEDF